MQDFLTLAFNATAIASAVYLCAAFVAHVLHCHQHPAPTLADAAAHAAAMDQDLPDTVPPAAPAADGFDCLEPEQQAASAEHDSAPAAATAGPNLSWTIRQLKQLARERRLKGYSNLTKAQLVARLA